MTTYLGLDVHSRRTVFVAQEEDGKIIARGDVATDRAGFEELLGRLGGELGIKTGLESGAQSFWVSEQLSELGFHPYVINAAEVRAKSLRPNQKSDGRDALEICDGLRRDLYVSRVYVPGRSVRRLRSLLGRRRFFIRQMTSQVNSAKALLRGEGVRVSFRLNTASGWKRALESCPDSFQRDLLRMHFRTWRQVSEEVARLNKKIEKEAGAHFADAYPLLQTVPGVGPVTAATFLSVIADAGRFERSGQAVSYLGLCPSSWDSGDRVVHGRITKRGSSEARSMLVEAAHHAGRPTHPLNPYFARVAARQGYKKAVVCVAQRLCRVMWRMMLDGEEFDAGKLNVTPTSKVKTRKYYWKIKEAV